MDAKEAAKSAKEYVADLFADEGIANVGVEEIQRGPSGIWEVTVGFTRPWDRSGTAMATYGQKALRRSYKVLRVCDSNGAVVSVKDRILREVS